MLSAWLYHGVSWSRLVRYRGDAHGGFRAHFLRRESSLVYGRARRAVNEGHNDDYQERQRHRNQRGVIKGENRLGEVKDAHSHGGREHYERQCYAQPDPQSPTHSGQSLADRSGIPSDQALEDLAHLTLHGRLTDIERWVDKQASEAAYAPFAAQLKELLDRFDFPAIHALALNSRRSQP